jgi:electron transfer flavoprotein alpha subunit
MNGAIWVIGEPARGGLAHISEEVATAARLLGAERGRDVAGVFVGANAAVGAVAMAQFVPRVLSVEVPAEKDHAWAAVAGSPLATLVEQEAPDYLLIGATPDGRDLAGFLSARLGWGILVNAEEIGWSETGPMIETSVFGGRLITTGGFTGPRGIVTVRPNSVAAVPIDAPGTVETVASIASDTLPLVVVVEHVVDASAAAPIEDAKVIVTGGRGVGGTEGFALVQELASELGGAVGATRPAVDEGWLPYAHQIGQTGKVVKPSLYVGLGVSGAIQHTVGMRGSSSVIAVDRVQDTPFAELADLFVVGDLFEVVPALIRALRERRDEA